MTMSSELGIFICANYRNSWPPNINVEKIINSYQRENIFMIEKFSSQKKFLSPMSENGLVNIFYSY